MTDRSFNQMQLDSILRLERERFIARAKELAASHRAVARLPVKPKQMDAAEALDELIEELSAGQSLPDAEAAIRADERERIARRIERDHAKGTYPYEMARRVRDNDMPGEDVPHPLERQIVALSEQIVTVTSQRLEEIQGLQAKVDRLCGALDCFTLPKRRMDGGYWKYDHEFVGDDDDDHCRECADAWCEHEWAKEREALLGDSPDRPHRLTWTGIEWVAPCGCRYHPDDDNGSHGGAPHVHRCEKHAALARSAEQHLREALAVARTFVESEARRRADEGQNNHALKVLQHIDECPALTDATRASTSQQSCVHPPDRLEKFGPNATCRRCRDCGEEFST